MGGCRCSYKSCKSATKTTENLHFFHYPVKHSERCATWIKNADKPEFINLPNDQLRNKVVCGLHFEDKYFTNVQKKRLVHDAVPTLDEGCEEEILHKDVQVYPTSIDGSTFTLQAEHLQPGPSRHEHKLGFKNGKMVMHKFEETESEVYTIDPSYIQQSFYFPTNSTRNVFINNTNDADQVIVYKSGCKDEEEIIYQEVEDPIIRNENEIVTYVQCNEADDNKNVNNIFYEEEPIEEEVVNNTNNIKEMEVIEIIEPIQEEPTKSQTKHEKIVKKRAVNKNVIKRINIHAQEIANIKRSLVQNNVKLPKKSIIRMLKGKVPDSLLGALSLHLNKGKKQLTQEEKAFLHAMYNVSPSAYQVLKKYGWYIPKHIVIDRGAESPQ